MVDAIRGGVATIAVLAREVGATLELFDVGVGRPTGNIRVADAMSVEEFDAAVDAGAAAIETVDADLLAVGEIGIGNTTAAAAVAAAVLGGVMPSTGSARAPAWSVQPSPASAMSSRPRSTGSGRSQPLGGAYRRLGGRELAAMAGAVAAARRRRLPVVLDGFIATAAVAPLAVARAPAASTTA